MSITGRCVPWVLSSVCALSGCGLLGEGSKASDSASSEEEHAQARRAPGKVVVEMPWETTKVRDDQNAPVVQVVLLNDGRRGVAVPYVYGYPLYPEGDAVRGLVKLRQDNAEGATREQRVDERGVTHLRELLPKIGCAIEGVLESETQFVPIELRCELPAPRDLGGAKRPVFGELLAGAAPREVIAQPIVRKAFYGDFHLQSGDLDKGKGDGEGYFNTDHGQLAFGFDRGKLASVSYFFDPPVKAWRDPALWAAP